MSRAFILVLDSVGIGSAPDADRHDAGADTLGHIAQACREGHGDRTGLRAGPLRLPNLARLGLGATRQDPIPELQEGPLSVTLDAAHLKGL